MPFSIVLFNTMLVSKWLDANLDYLLTVANRAIKFVVLPWNMLRCLSRLSLYTVFLHLRGSEIIKICQIHNLYTPLQPGT